MKTKLLRKFRKNYSISYHPSGYVDPSGNLHHSPVVVTKSIGFLGRVSQYDVDPVTEIGSSWTEMTIENAFGKLLKWFKDDHKSLYKKRSKKLETKFWYESKSNKQVRTQAA